MRFPAALRLACIITLLSCAIALPTIAADQKIVAYYFAREAKGYSYSPADINGDLLTHVNYAFADIRDGEVVVGNPALDVGEANHIGKLQALKHRYPHLKTLISVGGWGWSKEFSNVALDETARAKFSASAVAFVRRYGFDGVDIDWEFPVAGGHEHNAKRPQDKHNFTLLMQSLRRALDKAAGEDRRPYLLTAALGNNRQFLQNTEMDQAIKSMDWANIMTYDFAGPWDSYAGHNAPLYNDPATRRPGASPEFNVASTVEMTIGAGVPANKLVLGLPFYGYSWKPCGTANNGQQQDCAGKGSGTWEPGAVSYYTAQAMAGREGFVRYWNEKAEVPYLWNAQTREFIGYDDVESIARKIRFIRQRGLAGAMFWEISGDPEASLQKLLARELLGK